MNKIKVRAAFFCLVILAPLSGILNAQNTSTLTQISTIDALMAGLYEGEYSIGRLKQAGDFGLGTFNSLDGEMIVLNGEVYKLKADGNVELTVDNELTPYAAVTHFLSSEAPASIQFSSLKELESLLDGRVISQNYFYAVKIEGIFKTVTARSVPKQEKPYMPLIDVVKKQTEFKFDNVKGTLVGFRCPAYVKGINVPGYHFHFISGNRKSGGHLLDVQSSDVKIQMQQLNSFNMILPGDEEFMKVNLNRDRSAELHKVEKK